MDEWRQKDIDRMARGGNKSFIQMISAYPDFSNLPVGIRYSTNLAHWRRKRLDEGELDQVLDVASIADALERRPTNGEEMQKVRIALNFLSDEIESIRHRMGTFTRWPRVKDRSYPSNRVDRERSLQR